LLRGFADLLAGSYSSAEQLGRGTLSSEPESQFAAYVAAEAALMIATGEAKARAGQIVERFKTAIISEPLLADLIREFPK
jgi:hypothetical protein